MEDRLYCHGPNCCNLVPERSARCMTRALKNAVMQQQVFHADKALQILDQETAPLVVDRDKLKVWVYLVQFHFLTVMCSLVHPLLLTLQRKCTPIN